MSEAFCKIYLHHQAVYKISNVTEFANAAKLRIKNQKLPQINHHESTSQLVQLLVTKILYK